MGGGHQRSQDRPQRKRRRWCDQEGEAIVCSTLLLDFAAATGHARAISCKNLSFLEVVNPNGLVKQLVEQSATRGVE